MSDPTGRESIQVKHALADGHIELPSALAFHFMYVVSPPAPLALITAAIVAIKAVARGEPDSWVTIPRCYRTVYPTNQPRIVPAAACALQGIFVTADDLVDALALHEFVEFEQLGEFYFEAKEPGVPEDGCDKMREIL